MDDRKFDKLLKGILENPPVFQADKKVIAYMRRQLDEADKPKQNGRMGLPMWLLPLLLLPFLATSILFYNKYKKSNQTIHELNLQLLQYQTDTITHNYTLFHYDTVYNTIYKNVFGGQAPESSVQGGNPTQSNVGLSHSGLSQTRRLPIRPLRAISAGQNAILFSEGTLPGVLSFGNGSGFSLAKAKAMLEAGSNLLAELKKEEIGEEWRELSPLEKIAILPPGMVYPRFQFNLFLSDDHMIVPMPKDAKKRKKRINPLAYLTPTGFSLGIAESPLFFFMDNLGETKKRQLFGLTAEIKFIRNFRMTLGLEKLSVTFETKDKEEFEQFPTIQPNDPTDELKELYLNLDYLQIPIGFRYQFNENKKFKPFVGAAMIARKRTLQNFKYEFRSSSGEYEVEETFKSRPFSVNSIQASIGLDYNFWKDFNLEIEGIYNQAFRQNSFEFVKLKYFGLQFGLKYEFGKK